ncbi:hypothetical protein LCGC14_2368710, partial [marine sediment metagenome]
MADAPIVDPPVVEPVVAPPVTDPPAVHFNSDGTFGDGWQTTLPEGYRDEKSLSTVKDAKVLARMFVDTKRMVGKDMMEIPTETSSEETWDAYHKIGGKPETVVDY